jgi:hypothetical protein
MYASALIDKVEVRTAALRGGPSILATGMGWLDCSTDTDRVAAPQPPRKLQRSARKVYVTPAANSSEGTGEGGNIVKFCERKCWIFATDASDADVLVETWKRTDFQDLPADPVDPVKSSVSELQAVSVDGAARTTEGVTGEAGTLTPTVTADAAGLEAQFDMGHLARIPLARRVILLPTPSCAEPRMRSWASWDQ